MFFLVLPPMRNDVQHIYSSTKQLCTDKIDYVHVNHNVIN